MSRFSKYVREKVVKVLVAALVAGSVAGNEGITVQAAGADLNDPFSFVLYTNEFVSSNLDHIEGNAAIRELKVSMVSYGGKSYLGDLSAPNQILKYTASGRTDEKELIIPLTNSDGTQNSVEREVTGQGYNIIAGENKLYTGNLLKNCEVWDTDIASTISNVLAGNMVQKSNDLYALANENNDTQLVLNVTSAELNTRMEDYDKEITGAAFYGKTVVVNVSDSGTVNITGWMNAHGAKKQALEHQLWADRIIWNFGNATEVNVNSIFGYILAPKATVYNGGTVVGGIIADKYKQGGEIHCPCEPDEPESTPTPTVPVVTEEPTPTPVVTEEPTPTPVVTEEPTPTPTVPVVTEEPAPTATPTATPDTPDEPDTPDDTPDDPGTPNDPGTPAGGIPDTPQVLGARRRRMVTIEDEAVPLADRAVLGASRRPQTSDDSDAWNLGFAFSLTSLGAWLVLKRKEH
ncbi:collagen-binding domain-containing protein [Waltera sp.]|uniref:collagen-binding domain-containing protein n=1 Tax=Waltera sp. TaxID=2815806 RepID=UPI003AB970F3